jgi:hypothetical protein
MNPTNGCKSGRSSLARQTVFPLILGTLFLLGGCKSAPMWSAESRSPDGKLVATMEAFPSGGFAAPGPATTLVYLKETIGSQKPMLIFAFSEGPPDGMRVKMNWLSSSHLELVYGGQPTIDFQAVTL